MSNTQQKYTITFLPANRTIRVKAGSSLIKAARKAGLHINASCGGAGVCGKCRVLLEEGEVQGGTVKSSLQKNMRADTDRPVLPKSMQTSPYVSPRNRVDRRED